jgi:hypothetical protein
MSLIDVWKCCECGEIHNDYDTALECCPPQIDEGYLCPLCRKYHYFSEDAYACCGYEDGQEIPVSPLELEAAGQGRLIP